MQYSQKMAQILTILLKLINQALFQIKTGTRKEILTEKTLENINKIEQIENPEINYSIFNNLAYGQWTLKEIQSGEAWENISRNHK